MEYLGDYYRFVLKRRFKGILYRCYNKNSSSYKYYGGRGIKCEWISFDDFYKDMIEGFNPKLSIDRINNDGNYSKENCRWADDTTQANNKRSNILGEVLDVELVNRAEAYIRENNEFICVKVMEELMISRRKFYYLVKMFDYTGVFTRGENNKRIKKIHNVKCF